MINIAVLNETTVISDNDLVPVIAALQTQVRQHFAPIWGIDAEMQLIAGPPPKGWWWLVLLDDSDQAKTLGYHDTTEDCHPLGKVFVKTSQAAQANWTVTASHETLEMLADPAINLTVVQYDQDDTAGIQLCAYEICDACEADQFGYKIGDTLLSDFVYPSWFEPFHNEHSTQFDYCGHVKAPFALLPGGYATVRKLKSDGDWTQTSGRTLLARSAAGAIIQYQGRPREFGSRRERRRRPRSQWEVSKLPSHREHESRKPRMVAHAAGFVAARVMPTGASPVIVTKRLETKDVAAEIENAVAAVQSKADSLPSANSVIRVLQSAMAQANGADRNSKLLGAIPDQLELAVVLSSINGSAGRAQRVRAMDLIGFQAYEGLDPRWLATLYNRLVSERIPFPTHIARNLDPKISISNQTRIALAGDWGTGNASSRNIANRIADQRPHHTIHLGDVYYSGTDEEERSKFLAEWPSGIDSSAPCFALNSNHEMYSGGEGFFVEVLGNSRFSAQQGLSYFALVNDFWIILGLDSAYYASDYLYQKGNLGSLQLQWIRDMASAARVQGKKVMLFTHHHGVDIDPDVNSVSFQEPFWSDTIQALDGGPDYWYWGHVHAGIIFKPIAGRRSVLCRCTGHGGVPYAPFPDPQQLGDGKVKVEWAETAKAGDPNEDRRALNGFVIISFDGQSVLEEFYDENGNLRYSVLNGTHVP